MAASSFFITLRRPVTANLLLASVPVKLGLFSIKTYFASPGVMYNRLIDAGFGGVA
ncbi:hypothetical protein [Paenibacillus contaminans]|uniref:hypothetical protein n=1 Tax=Paenibacillus contaminans TaxID=450362 RepID=UPI001314082E|nr:hypothetical protein [Paenibacillus contaminans]